MRACSPLRAPQFSRSGEPAASGFWRGARVNIPYVQDLIEAEAAAVCACLLEAGGHVYVCGDGQKMAKDVHAALVVAISAKMKMSAADAEAKLSELSEGGRYCREIWN